MTGTADSFELPRIRRNSSVDISIYTGLFAKQRAFRKYGWPIPASYASVQSDAVQAATFKRRTPQQSSSAYAKSDHIAEKRAPHVPTLGARGTQTGIIAAIPNLYHASYISPVVIGGQTMHLDLDTGSADIWAFSSYLPNISSNGHTTYKPHKSLSFRNLTNEYFAIAYGDGASAYGLVGTDTISLGAARIPRQAFGLATNVTAEFIQATGTDGLLGLAFPTLNSIRPTRQNTILQNLLPTLRSPVFTTNFGLDGSGTYTFGNIPHSAYHAPLVNVPVATPNGLWQFSSPAFSIAAHKTYTPLGAPAIADTGTSIMLVDSSVLTAYWRTVKGAVDSDYYGGWVYPCSETADLPTFGVGMGAQEGSGTQIEPKTMVTVPGGLMGYAQLDDIYCYGSLQSNEGFGLQVYGDPLFRSAFVAFYVDAGAPSLGIARKA